MSFPLLYGAIVLIAHVVLKTFRISPCPDTLSGEEYSSLWPGDPAIYLCIISLSWVSVSFSKATRRGWITQVTPFTMREHCVWLVTWSMNQNSWSRRMNLEHSVLFRSSDASNMDNMWQSTTTAASTPFQKKSMVCQEEGDTPEELTLMVCAAVKVRCLVPRLL